MPQALGEQDELALERGRVHGERQRTRQHLHEQRGPAGQLDRHELPALAQRPHLALDPVDRAQGLLQRHAEIGHGCGIT